LIEKQKSEASNELSPMEKLSKYFGRSVARMVRVTNSMNESSPSSNRLMPRLTLSLNNVNNSIGSIPDSVE